MGGELSQRLVPVLPSFRLRPQGGGTAPVDQRAVFTAVVYVLTIRYERKDSHFLAFLGLAAAMTCYKKLAKITT